MYPLGKTLAELIPSGSEKKDFFWITPLPLKTEIDLPPAQEKLVTFLNKSPQGIALNSISKISGLKEKNLSPIDSIYIPRRERFYFLQKFSC